MKLRSCWCALAWLAWVGSAFAGPRDEQWKAVEAAAKGQLPKTALERLEPIIQQALAEKAYPEAVKAIVWKCALSAPYTAAAQNTDLERIKLLRDEIERAPAAAKPVMETILADWYWEYFLQHRWQIAQRTAGGAGTGSDVATWDLRRILAEIDVRFTAALADPGALQQIRVSDYEPLLVSGKAPDRYRPTLFDFLAYQALQFYQAGEQAGVAAEDDFEIAVDSPIFGPVEAFRQWRPGTAEGRSPKLQAVRLYQALLAFHERDADRAAFDDADLARLRFGANVAVGEDKDTTYLAALEAFVARTHGREIASRGYAELARQLAEEDPAKAHVFARRGLELFPNSAGAAACANVIADVEAPQLNFETEFVWNPPSATLDLMYRNIRKAYFRAVPLNYREFLDQTQRRGRISEAMVGEALAAKPKLAWEAALPPTPDFKRRTERIPAPSALPAGFYLVLASADRSFATSDNRLGVAAVWVSDLALVMNPSNRDGTASGLVVRAGSGEPVPEATVRIWHGRGHNGGMEEMPAVQTDADGRFTVSAEDGSVALLVERGGQAVSTSEEFYTYRSKQTEADAHTVFFTDRSIYRPGQTIHYKGLSLRADRNAGRYEVRPGQPVTVIFRDVNEKEIARAEHRTNDYGSFSGEFTAPRDRLPGRMTLRSDAPEGQASFAVEEYKRPKFEVELRAPAEAARLGAPVTVRGVATAYTGAAVGGAKVVWRVERIAHMPAWCWWWHPANRTIAHGTAVTGQDGTFTLEFPATPDRAVPAQTEPTFVFSIEAEVTDTTGETRSADRIVRVGYAALQATVAADDWQTVDRPVVFRIRTASLDGEPRSAKGTLTIHALKQPAAVARAALRPISRRRASGGTQPPIDPADPETWELAEPVAQRSFEVEGNGAMEVTAPLPVGAYRAMLATVDPMGRVVTARCNLQVIDRNATQLAIKVPHRFAMAKTAVEPGETFTAYWGTGYDAGRAFVEIDCNGKTLQRGWTAAGRTQASITQAVGEEMRGGFTVRVTFVRENRAYTESHIVQVPWTNKALSVRWESFRSKLQPGAPETWTAVVSGPGAQKAAAEMVATLYDASLDQFQAHGWPGVSDRFRTEPERSPAEFQNIPVSFRPVANWRRPKLHDASWRYRSFAPEVATMFGREDLIVLSPFEIGSDSADGYMAAAPVVSGGRVNTFLMDAGALSEPMPTIVTVDSFVQSIAPPPPEVSGTPEPPNIAGVAARRNLNETAFFYPHLLTNEKGEVRITFTAPEALTRWKFLGFAHDRELRSGLLTGTAVTAKDLMVEPNPPRFLREGDTVEFTVKVTNQSEQPQKGTVRLTFADAASLQSVDAALANAVTDQPFELGPKQSRSYFWRITVPDGQGFLTYKAVAASAAVSDGEEGALPVLSRRVLVTESLPLQIRGAGERGFEFKKLLDSGSSPTLRHQALTVQMASQPAWYAVMALPYLMEFPFECSEQVFHRYYANALARHVANADPKIRRVFELWKSTPALESPLEKNQDLKAVMLEETPWVRDAADQRQNRRNLGLLFDAERLDEQAAATLRKLAERQLGDGRWAWFPGGPPSDYISLTIVAGFGRLRAMGVNGDVAPAVKCLPALDAWIAERHRQIQRSAKPEAYVPTPMDALYLYARSFFTSGQPVSDAAREAVEFLQARAKQSWTQVGSRQAQAQLALGIERFGDSATAQAIVRSLRERSVTTEEMGMSWPSAEASWWWYEAPIETQAMMIELFDEVAHDAKAVENCQVWLLQQKRTQDWRTTTATADAVYALLRRGANPLASDALVEVSLGGQPVRPAPVEAGTGFYEQKFAGAQVTPAMGHIVLRKTDPGMSWGGVHWQYLEDMSRVTPHEGTPLKLKKALLVKETTARGPVLQPVTGPVAVGDELVVRIELRTDRDLEFVHLKDQRGSGVEPVEVLSRYRYQDGLGYYETTRDTATHFFFDYVPAGTYVFEYSTRVQLKGRYQSGIAEIQCMYAPEFNSHSESVVLDVR
jgi:uncharacterized protein YfaS (alpha-2-macroglobulin family)